MTLRDVIAMLKKSGIEPQETVKGLSYLPLLIERKPDELASMALEISKLLISIHIPKWAPEDIKYIVLIINI